ncbi:peptidoglycan DD-metalloendopeptidase family protein [Pontibacillus litoralis]|nr:peptidoglycan DD-metalloendopeptidase family protein [Pontibacillus litoralis]
MKKENNPNTFVDTAKRKYTSFGTKVVLTTCLGLGITAGTVQADEDEQQIPTVYHVYVDGEHIGTVENKNIVDEAIQQQINKVEQKHKGMELVVGEEVSYVPEKMYRASFDNKDVLKDIKEEINIQADATAVVVDGEVVGYAQSKEVAEAAVTKLKAKYLPKKAAAKLKEDSNYFDTKDVELEDSTIKDVKLSAKVSYSDEEVKPSNVLTADELVQVMEKGTLEEKKHTVKDGEVLGEIASQYNLSTQELLDLNKGLDEGSVLDIGQEINVTEYNSFLDVVVTEEKKEESTIEYETEVKKSEKLYKGDEEVRQEGKDGKKETEYQITKKNGNVINEEVLHEEVTEKPQKEIIVKGTKVVPSRGTGSLNWPAAGGTITSKQGQRWGAYHKGIDIAGVSNRTISAADNGTVVSAGYDGGYGNKVVINHNNGLKTVYAHMSSIKVNAGQTVEKGQPIGIMGSTGDSTGVHLHFEVYKNGSLQNPLNYVR